MPKINGNPVKMAHRIGPSIIVVTIDPSHVKRLQIDDDVTFFEERPVENGILLMMRKLGSVEMVNDNKK